MSRLLSIFLFSCVTLVASEWCDWTPVGSSETFRDYCAFGCCSYFTYPCCDTPFYRDTPFIAGITCGIIALVMSVLYVLLRWKCHSPTTTRTTITTRPTTTSNTNTNTTVRTMPMTEQSHQVFTTTAAQHTYITPPPKYY